MRGSHARAKHNVAHGRHLLIQGQGSLFVRCNFEQDTITAFDLRTVGQCDRCGITLQGARVFAVERAPVDIQAAVVDSCSKRIGAFAAHVAAQQIAGAVDHLDTRCLGARGGNIGVRRIHGGRLAPSINTCAALATGLDSAVRQRDVGAKFGHRA
ncbi:hypothetical protein D3C77_446070 [compost metagenome]